MNTTLSPGAQDGDTWARTALAHRTVNMSRVFANDTSIADQHHTIDVSSMVTSHRADLMVIRYETLRWCRDGRKSESEWISILLEELQVGLHVALCVSYLSGKSGGPGLH